MQAQISSCLLTLPTPPAGHALKQGYSPNKQIFVLVLKEMSSSHGSTQAWQEDETLHLNSSKLLWPRTPYTSKMGNWLFNVQVSRGKKKSTAIVRNKKKWKILTEVKQLFLVQAKRTPEVPLNTLYLIWILWVPHLLFDILVFATSVFNIPNKIQIMNSEGLGFLLFAFSTTQSVIFMISHVLLDVKIIDKSSPASCSQLSSRSYTNTERTA